MNECMNNAEAIQSFVTDLSLMGYSENTVKAYTLTVTRTFSYLKKDYTKITTQDLKTFLVHLQREKGCSLKTIRRHVNALRSFFRIFEMDIADKIRLPKVEKSLPTFLNFAEIKDLLQCIKNERDLAIIRLLYASGIRVSEMVNLNRDSIEKNTIMVRSGKGKKDRVVIIDKGTANLIKFYISKRKDKNTALFVNQRGKRITDRYIQILVKKYAKKAGIKKKVTPHTLRHTFATHLLQNKANIMVIKDLLGHASLSTTQIYTHVTDDFKKEVYVNAHPLSRQ